MPLRDHFHPPLKNFASWEELHGLWPGIITLRLNATLPPQYRCGLKVHLGTLVEVDVATFEQGNGTEPHSDTSPGNGSAWEAVAPTLLLETEELTRPLT